MQDSCEIDVEGMSITIQPRKRKTISSLFDSMWTSMASSIQLAAECLQSVDEDTVEVNTPTESPNSIPGLEQCAQAIDAGIENFFWYYMDK